MISLLSSSHRALTAVAVFLAVASSANAAVVFYTNREAWQAAAGQPSFTEDFSRIVPGTPFISAPLALNGMTIQQEGTERTDWNQIDVSQFSPNSGSNAALLLTNFPEGTSSGTQVRIVFTGGPNKAFGLESWSAGDGEGVVLEVFNGTTRLSVANLSGADGAFLGYVLTGTDTATSVRLRSSGLIAGMLAERFYIDNLAGVAADNPPAFTAHPASAAVEVGGNATFTVSANGTPAPAYQWQLNGVEIAGATSASLTISNVQPANAGIYRVAVSNSAGAVTSNPAILGIASTAKVIGTGSEVGVDLQHPNGNFFDQVLLTGAAATVTADAGQVLRLSYIDLTDDIVQVEFSGAGALTLVIDGGALSGPALPVKYNQAIAYMKGHGSIVIAGANETTNVSVFSVGRATAVNQALFRDDVVYDGTADLASLAVMSSNGKFGGLRTANASYYATKGFTGVYAPGVQFPGVAPAGAFFIADISAFDDATPVILIGSADDSRITGGDLLQANGRAIQVSGLTQLKFQAGTTSHGTALPAQSNRGVLEQNGVNVTAQVVLNPTPSSAP